MAESSAYGHGCTQSGGRRRVTRRAGAQRRSRVAARRADGRPTPRQHCIETTQQSGKSGPAPRQTIRESRRQTICETTRAPGRSAPASPERSLAACLSHAGLRCRLRLRLLCDQRPRQVSATRRCGRGSGGSVRSLRAAADAGLERTLPPAAFAELLVEPNAGPCARALRGHHNRGLESGRGARQESGVRKFWNTPAKTWSAIWTGRSSSRI